MGFETPRITTPAAATALPAKLEAAGYGKLARLGSLALKAVGQDGLTAVQMTGMTPALANDLLAALVPVADALVKAKPIDANDAKAVVAAFARGEVGKIAFDGEQFERFTDELVKLAETPGQTASAITAFKNFDALYNGDGITWGEGDLSYWVNNSVAALTERLREAVRKAGVDPDAAGLPEPGPQAL